MRFIYSKIFAWFVVALCISVIALLLQTKGWYGPIQKFFLYLPRPVVQLSKKIAYPVRGFVKNIYSIRAIVEKNGELEKTVAHLEGQLVGLQYLYSENESLKKELGFVQKSSVPHHPCTVLALDPEGVTNTMVLSCGSKDGIKAGQAVVSGGFLVGKVFVVNNSTSTATVLSSSNFSVDARVSGSDISGLVKGSYGSGITVDLISQTANISKGDLVVTAGINELIPKNILIGEVGDTVSGPNDLFKKVTLYSPVNYKNLDYVFVVK